MQYFLITNAGTEVEDFKFVTPVCKLCPFWWQCIFLGMVTQHVLPGKFPANISSCTKDIPAPGISTCADNRMQYTLPHRKLKPGWQPKAPQA